MTDKEQALASTFGPSHDLHISTLDQQWAHLVERVRALGPTAGHVLMDLTDGGTMTAKLLLELGGPVTHSGKTLLHQVMIVGLSEAIKRAVDQITSEQEENQ